MLRVRSVQLVDRPLAGLLAADALAEQDLAPGADRDVLDAVLLGLRAQHERGVADAGEEGPHDRWGQGDEDDRPRPADPTLARDQRRPERARRVERPAGEPAEGQDG